VTITDLTELDPAARHAAQDVLAVFAAALRPAPAAARDEALAEVRAHLLDALGPEATEADVARVAADLGDPAEFVRGLLGDQTPRGTSRAPREGTILGVPYGLNVPGTDTVASRWWNPRDPRILVPRVFGIGWDLNFGALAVFLHLIEPDAEDEPFELVPDHVFIALAAIPVAIALAFTVFVVATWAAAPARIAVHWSGPGVADNWWPRAAALAFSALWVFPPTAWAVVSQFTGRKALNRGVTVAFATLLGALGAGFYVGGVVEGLGGPGIRVVWVSLAAGLVVPFVELVVLARVGRAEEWRRAGMPGRRGAAS